jgi:aspartyl-tRNA synthetase
MITFRTHTCGELNKSNKGQDVSLSGWVHKKRDHGNLLFIDLRDNYGISQCVIEKGHNNFSELEKIPLETVIKVDGLVLERSRDTINSDLETGDIEISIANFTILGTTKELPLPIFLDEDYSEDIRLKYRFLDLRRKRIHKNIILRSNVISFIREEMKKMGFLEFQTPILTSSSPEGARDFLVPSRLNPGKFYALPQAPQQFKQLIMVAGFDKYFQIAPCFRDEDARSDRSPGEFYQLDVEMSFVNQNQIFEIIEKLFVKTFEKFSNNKILNKKFPQISYEDALLKYGSDKPDLRNPLVISDVSKIFEREDVKFDIFKKLILKGNIVRAIVTKKTIDKPRSFFDGIDKWARTEGASGLAYFSFEEINGQINGKGTVGKLFSVEAIKEIMKITNAQSGDSIFFACGIKGEVERILSLARSKIAEELNLINENEFAFCWIVDYPMYEIDEKTKKIVFSHNPFSMPQGDIQNLDFANPLSIKAFQYDIVCNGVELSSGAIRNHMPDLMYKLFSIAGYSIKEVDNQFSGMINALSFGAPPHGGIAPGIDRIVMLLANEKNIREVTMFPMNQNAQDLMMNAPSDVNESQLNDLSIKIVKKKLSFFAFYV